MRRGGTKKLMIYGKEYIAEEGFEYRWSQKYLDEKLKHNLTLFIFLKMANLTTNYIRTTIRVIRLWIYGLI